MKADEIAEGRRLLERAFEVPSDAEAEAFALDWLWVHKEALLSAAEQLEAAVKVVEAAEYVVCDANTVRPGWAEYRAALAAFDRLTKTEGT